MATSCKGTCENFRAESVQNKVRYVLGHKRCSYCSIFLQVEGVRCPCCGAKMRSKARHKKRKAVYEMGETANAACCV